VAESRPKREPRPELILGLVGAVGTDLAFVVSALEESLREVDYEAGEVRLSDLLREFPRWASLPTSPEDVRIQRLMDAGNEFRKITKREDALAVLGVGMIRELRENITGDPTIPAPQKAYILRSLKNPKEVDKLREIYRSGFLLVSAYSPLEVRLQNLAKRIADSRHQLHIQEYRVEAEQLNKRDEFEVGESYGQNVQKTFPKADAFLNASDPSQTKASVNRFIEILFRQPFHTPTKDEYAMFHAQAAALRSASLSRQVGTVVATGDGDIVAVGTNEVPKAGGGLYWCSDQPDHRDFTLGHDTNDQMKRTMVAEVFEKLRESGWLSKEKSKEEVSHLVDQALNENPSGVLKAAQINNVIEFIRSVHAEMAALIDAARRGVSVKGATLYTTTFPCHDCAKHIVAAGISRVVYIHPYPKSLAPDLYPDSIDIDPVGSCCSGVRFDPFVGVAPRQYIDFFEMVDRKTKEGQLVKWEESEARPRLFGLSLSYLANEQNELDSLKATFPKKLK
jgi:cytidine deaminase